MSFRPIHLSARDTDMAGNGGRGRFFLLPGSPGRARKIAEGFDQHEIRTHPRGHDVHLGTIERIGKRYDVGVVSTGMGCPSIDIIVNELLALGARWMIRVGTSGALQPTVHTGDLVVATGAVRDEAASGDYLPTEFPALASWPVLLAAQRAAAAASGLRGRVHFGPVHTKDTLYARELGYGPLAAEHKRYTDLLARAGILASEMECAHLFVLSQVASKEPALVGAILAVIGEHDQPFIESPRAAEAVDDAIELAFLVGAELLAALPSG